MLKRTFVKGSQSELFDSGRLRHLIGNDMVITGQSEHTIPFGYRTVGKKRFYDAQIAGDEIDVMVSIPMVNLTDEIMPRDCVELTNFRTGKTEIFKVIQRQMKYDSAPASVYLSLASGGIDVTDER